MLELRIATGTAQKTIREDDMDVTEIRGLYVGQLNAEEMATFEKAIDLGLAFRDYDHPGAILGLAKVGVRRPTHPKEKDHEQ